MPGDDPKMCKLSFDDLIQKYQQLQTDVLRDVKNLSQNLSSAQPGRFLLMQFEMSQVTQVGESISNLISQVNSLINAAIRNQKPQ